MREGECEGLSSLTKLLARPSMSLSNEGRKPVTMAMTITGEMLQRGILQEFPLLPKMLHFLFRRTKVVEAEVPSDLRSLVTEKRRELIGQL